MMLLAAFFALSGPFAGLDHAKPPPRIDPFWAGLPAPAARAPAEGIVALKEPLERRVRISGGKFVMGSTAAEVQRGRELCFQEPAGARYCQDDSEEYRLMFSEQRPHEVTVRDIDLDRTEVSVARYRRCVAAGACSPPGFVAGDARFDRGELPVTHVTWDDAESYCRWTGGRLPTEAEWEHAARGRGGHAFPWGDLYNPHLANHGSLSEDETDARDGYAGLAPIGSFPDGATQTGLLDMAGNAAEWVFDYYDRDADGLGYRSTAVVDPKGPTSSQFGHVVRGGSYRTGGYALRTAARRFAWGAGGIVSSSREIGFRCAYDVAPAAGAP